jgi:hypothetical protein
LVCDLFFHFSESDENHETDEANFADDHFTLDNISEEFLKRDFTNMRKKRTSSIPVTEIEFQNQNFN